GTGARLGEAVDAHGFGDLWQRAGGGDGLNATTGDIEDDGVGAADVGGGVGVEDGLAQRAGAAIEGVADGEGGGNLAPLQRLQAGPERTARFAERGLGPHAADGFEPGREPIHGLASSKEQTGVEETTGQVGSGRGLVSWAFQGSGRGTQART